MILHKSWGWYQRSLLLAALVEPKIRPLLSIFLQSSSLRYGQFWNDLFHGWWCRSLLIMESQYCHVARTMQNHHEVARLASISQKPRFFCIFCLKAKPSGRTTLKSTVDRWDPVISGWFQTQLQAVSFQNFQTSRHSSKRSPRLGSKNVVGASTWMLRQSCMLLMLFTSYIQSFSKKGQKGFNGYTYFIILQALQVELQCSTMSEMETACLHAVSFGFHPFFSNSFQHGICIQEALCPHAWTICPTENSVHPSVQDDAYYQQILIKAKGASCLQSHVE